MDLRPRADLAALDLTTPVSFSILASAFLSLARTTGGGGHGSVLLGLHSLLLPESTPHTSGGLAELVLSVLVVLRELLADGGEGLVKLHSHAVQLGVGGGLVLLDELLELNIVLEVLLVTLVTELDHAAHLSVHVGVHLSLGGAVGAHNVGSGVDPVVHLGHLLLHGGREGEKGNLELGLGGVHLLLGVVAGGLDVTHSLGVTLGLEGLLGVEGSLKAHGGLLECHVNLVTVLSHLSLNIVEL